MRSSRLSQETSKLFNGTRTESLLPPRVTRSRLARFSYDTDQNSSPNANGYPKTSSSTRTKDAQGAERSSRAAGGVVVLSPTTTDIEDALPASPSTPTTKSATKRRRVTVKEESPTKIKLEIDSIEHVESKIEGNVPASPRRVRKPARVIKDGETGETSVEPPTDWEDMYNVMREMRLHGVARNAAVDTMGCERLATEEATPREKRFHTLIALMLSSQTKDTVNFAAMERLKNELPPHEPGAKPGLTIENVIAVEPSILNELIWQVGFHNNKTKFIKQAAVILRDKFDSDIPDTIEGMISLPGVGPKMAYLLMSSPNGWSRIEGIGTDTHVHRITNLWGWQRPPSKTPEETRLALQAWLPKEYWRDINWLMVGLGQTICLPVGRKCGQCELGLRGLCKSADRKKVFEARRLKVEKEEIELEVKTENDGPAELVVTEKVAEAKEEIDLQSGELVVPKDEDMAAEQLQEEALKGLQKEALQHTPKRQAMKTAPTRGGRRRVGRDETI